MTDTPLPVTTDETGKPTGAPQPKVIAATVGAGVGTAVGTVTNYLIETIAQVDLPEPVENAILVIVAAGVAFLAGYVKRPSANAS